MNEATQAKDAADRARRRNDSAPFAVIAMRMLNLLDASPRPAVLEIAGGGKTLELSVGYVIVVHQWIEPQVPDTPTEPRQDLVVASVKQAAGVRHA